MMLQARWGAAFVPAVYHTAWDVSQRFLCFVRGRNRCCVSNFGACLRPPDLDGGGFDGLSTDPAAYIHLDIRAHHYFPL